MSFFRKWNILLPAAILLMMAAGCSQIDNGPVDEEKEPHFVLGKSREQAWDYDGAIRAFEESLEANPHSAQAHYQLAILYDNQESVADPAAAIYHYQQCLKYDPKFPNADAIAGRIDTCKQKLAENVLQLPSTPATQQQLEKLTEENRRLHDQLAQWQAYYVAQQAAAKTNPPTPQYGNPYQPQTQSQTYTPQPQAQPISSTPDDVTPQTYPVATTGNTGGTAGSGTAAGNSTTSHKPADTRPARPRTHTVASGETLANIARKCGVSVQALEEANPYVNPRKLKAGQILKLPPP